MLNRSWSEFTKGLEAPASGDRVYHASHSFYPMEAREHDRRMFIYFDLGNVVALFDRAQQCRQMADAAGLAAEQVHAMLFDTGLNDRYERGQISSSEFCEAFRRQTSSKVEDNALL